MFMVSTLYHFIALVIKLAAYLPGRWGDTSSRIHTPIMAREFRATETRMLIRACHWDHSHTKIRLPMDRVYHAVSEQKLSWC